MSAQHTPGPYEYRPDRTIVANGLPLARCYADRNGGSNGPLFAAALELLKALDFAIGRLLAIEPGKRSIGQQRAINEGLAVIAKATGADA